MVFLIRRPNPIWDEIPQHFKRDVFQHLPANDKLRMRSVSLVDRHIIDNTESLYRNVHLAVAVMDTHGEKTELRCDEATLTYRRPEVWAKSVTDLLTLFAFTKTSTELLVVEHKRRTMLETRREFHDKLIRALDSKGPEFKLKVKCLVLDMCMTSAQFIKIMSFIDPTVLKKLHVRQFRLSTVISNKILEMDLWKNVEFLIIPHSHIVPLCRFLHTNSFCTCIRNMRPTDVFAAVKNVIDRRLEPGGGFLLTPRLTEVRIPEVMALLLAEYPDSRDHSDPVYGWIRSEWRTSYAGVHGLNVVVVDVAFYFVTCSVFRPNNIEDSWCQRQRAFEDFR